MPAPQPPRPFFSNFLAAFRAHSTFQHPSTPSSPSTTTSKSSSSHNPPSTTSHTTQPSQPRPINKPGHTTAALTSLSPRRGGRSPSPGNLDGAVAAQGGNAGTAAAGNGAANGAWNRRGSDSSSEGFRDVMGKEKWYIGGRTQGGEERYFKLGVIRRRRSGGELSLDRLSL